MIFFDEVRFIGEAIESVLRQTFEDWELLLVDDGSADGSSDVARRAEVQDPIRVRYLEHEGHENRGMSASRNLALEGARGELVAFLDGDDVWMPRMLESLVGLLVARDDVDMAYGDTLFWHGWTGVPRDVARDALRGIGLAPGTVIRPPQMATLCYPLGPSPSPAMCSLLVRRSVVDAVGGFEESFRGMFEDQAFLSKVYLRATICVTGECVAKYRVHRDSAVSTSVQMGLLHQDTSRFLHWLERFYSAQEVTTAAALVALRALLRRHRKERLLQWATPLRRIATRFFDAGWKRWNHWRRVMSRRSVGTISAHPNPVRVRDRFSVGATTLSWETHRATAVEVRVGAPDGGLLAGPHTTGQADTDSWVTDGTLFHLQDVSGGLPLSRANTIATTRVWVVAERGKSDRQE